MSNTSFWKQAYQLFKPEEPLTKAEDLRDFYVPRANSPVEDLTTFLEMEEDPAKFLLAGHRGGSSVAKHKRSWANPSYLFSFALLIMPSNWISDLT